MVECGIRWAVEAKRKGRGTEKEQGKKVQGAIRGDATAKHGRTGRDECP